MRFNTVSIYPQISSLKKQIDSGIQEMTEMKMKLEEDNSRLKAQLVDEKEKSAGLESQLADLLVMKPR
jgi:hypothetical protein